MFASEYVPASFDDVCRVLDRSTPPDTGLRITGGLKRRSGTVAAMNVEWTDPSSPETRREAEIRIIQAQSGTAPLTELLLVAPSAQWAGGARLVLEGLARRIEVDLSGMSASPGKALSTGSQ